MNGAVAAFRALSSDQRDFFVLAGPNTKDQGAVRDFAYNLAQRFGIEFDLPKVSSILAKVERMRRRHKNRGNGKKPFSGVGKPMRNFRMFRG